uniref:Adenine-specific methyltransferase n=1 Tax=Siphoviridae sp. ctcPV5 TaxID=2827582 RepID=A0A8S5LKS4_9CAUD|nr:MAG TPA: adenine-specific methyltransferase [Siphoviridae sp. ctcPV5]
MTMDWAKKYTEEERANSDEYYTPMDLVEEHFELTKKYTGFARKAKFATTFGDNNPYTKFLVERGFDVKEFNRFENLLESGETDRFVFDNPPFSTAQKDRTKLEQAGFKYSLLGSGTWLPKAHKHGMILFEQPRKYYHRKEQVLTSIFHNVDEFIYCEYNRKSANKYSRDFIAMNLKQGTYKQELFK